MRNRKHMAKIKVVIYIILKLQSYYVPINGLPQDEGAWQPTGIRLRKVRVGGDFDIHNGP